MDPNPESEDAWRQCCPDPVGAPRVQIGVATHNITFVEDVEGVEAEGQANVAGRGRTTSRRPRFEQPCTAAVGLSADR